MAKKANSQKKKTVKKTTVKKSVKKENVPNKKVDNKKTTNKQWNWELTTKIFGGIILILTSEISISSEITSTSIGNSAFAKIDSGVLVYIVTLGFSFIVIGIAMS